MKPLKQRVERALQNLRLFLLFKIKTQLYPLQNMLLLQIRYWSIPSSLELFQILPGCPPIIHMPPARSSSNYVTSPEKERLRVMVLKVFIAYLDADGATKIVAFFHVIVNYFCQFLESLLFLNQRCDVLRIGTLRPYRLPDTVGIDRTLILTPDNFEIMPASLCQIFGPSSISDQLLSNLPR